MKDLIIKHGVHRVIQLIIDACRERQTHYKLNYSTYAAWADVLEEYLPEITNKVVDRYNKVNESL